MQLIVAVPGWSQLVRFTSSLHWMHPFQSKWTSRVSYKVTEMFVLMCSLSSILAHWIWVAVVWIFYGRSQCHRRDSWKLRWIHFLWYIALEEGKKIIQMCRYFPGLWRARMKMIFVSQERVDERKHALLVRTKLDLSLVDGSSSIQRKKSIARWTIRILDMHVTHQCLSHAPGCVLRRNEWKYIDTSINDEENRRGISSRWMVRDSSEGLLLSLVSESVRQVGGDELLAVVTMRSLHSGKTNRDRHQHPAVFLSNFWCATKEKDNGCFSRSRRFLLLSSAARLGWLQVQTIDILKW